MLSFSAVPRIRRSVADDETTFVADVLADVVDDDDDGDDGDDDDDNDDDAVVAAADPRQSRTGPLLGWTGCSGCYWTRNNWTRWVFWAEPPLLASNC